MAGPLETDIEDVGSMRMESPANPELSFHLFSILPNELCLEIIEQWIRSRGYIYRTPVSNLSSVWSSGWTDTTRSRRRNPLAQYATVNKQWKAAVEKHTFRFLSLELTEVGGSASLDAFERICVEGRINAVTALSISISHFRCRFGRYGTKTALNTTVPAGGHGDNPDLSIVQIKPAARAAFERVLKVLERFRDSNLKSFHLHSRPDWHRMADPMLPAHCSLHLGLSLYASTCRVEELRLWHVVGLPYFLKQSWTSKKDPPRGPPTPAWPNLRILSLRDHVNVQTPDHNNREAAELYESVTHALPQIPKLSRLDLELEIPSFVGTERPLGLQSTRVYIQIPPPDGRSATRDGDLCLHGPAPDQGTIDKWLQIARRQWDCKLRTYRGYRGLAC